MKTKIRLVSLMMAVVMLVCLVACNGAEKKAFDISKQAYDKLHTAHELINTYSGDVYEAWMTGIYDDDELSLSHLADETSLSLAELKEGLAHYSCEIMEENYATLSEKDKDSYRTEFWFGAVLGVMEQDFGVCIDVVNHAYEVSGKSAEIKTLLNESKELLKSLSTDYSDYEHYPNLKNLYTCLNAFFEYCEDPDGSFEQSKTTINDYRNEARDYFNDLEFIFEE